MVVSGDRTDAVDAGSGDVATADSAETAAAIGPEVTGTRLAGPALLFSNAVSADDERSRSAAVARLLRLADVVDNGLEEALSRLGALGASTPADVALALGADLLAAGLLVDEVFEAADECAGLLVAGLPGDDDDDESEDPASAAATPQPVASATPTPKKTASPPTRPTSPEALNI